MRCVLLAVISLLALSAGAQAADDINLKHLKATNSGFRCDLSEAELRGADLTGVDLSVAELHLTSELTQQQVSSACSDSEKPPRLPIGLESPPSCAD